MPPIPLPPWPIPTFNLQIHDLDHEGVDIFFGAVKPKEALKVAVLATFKHLYTPLNVPTNVEQITLILKPMGGVANTCGTDTCKTITFSLDHIKNTRNRARDEIMGVLVHEVVHCYQYNAKNTCPGGLIEGIADFVRLHEGLANPAWTKIPGDEWDAGYEKTAYFLDWIENRYGEGTICELNESMKDAHYRQHIFKELTGRPLEKLWNKYQEECSAPM